MAINMKTLPVLCSIFAVAFSSVVINVEDNAHDGYVRVGQLSADDFEGFVSIYGNSSDAENLVAINGLVDTILEELSKLMLKAGLDPLPLPDIHESFSYKPIIITYHGELDLTNGLAEGTSTLYRGGDVDVNIKRLVATVDVPLNFEKFLITYDYSAKIMNIGPRGQVEAKVSDINVFFSISLDVRKKIITLNEFKLTKIGKIKVRFYGNWLFDWLLNILSDLVTTICKKLIVHITEGVIADKLQQLINIINSILASN